MTDLLKAQVETQLKTGGDAADSMNGKNASSSAQADQATLEMQFTNITPISVMDIGNMASLNGGPPLTCFGPFWDPDTLTAGSAFVDLPQGTFGFDDPIMSWELISLGLEEPLPTDDVVAELQVSRRSHPLPWLTSIHPQNRNLFCKSTSNIAVSQQGKVFGEYASGSKGTPCHLLTL